MKKAFSLVELIVVIAIIGVLAGILLSTFTGGTESARAATCLANMRNLAMACQTYAAEAKHYPPAGSLEYMSVDESKMNDPQVRYNEYKGWISWNSKGVYHANPRPTSHSSSSSWMVSMYTTDIEAGTYCLTNGALWKFVGANRKTFVCPNHVRGRKTPPFWSYLMNSSFSWDFTKGGEATGDLRIEYGTLDRADRRLLFGEVPFSGIGTWQPEGSGSGTDCDGVLQFDGSVVSSKSPMLSGSENIGVNHKNGQHLFAHVAFADGHTEKFRIPYSGSIKNPQIDDGSLRQLTAWLCAGLDVSFDSKSKTYQKVDQ